MTALVDCQYALVILFTLFKLKPSSIMLMVLVLSLRLGHACFCQHYSMKWTAAGETVTGDGSRLRGSKRLKTTTPATAQGPQHGQRCNPKPTRNQSMMKVTEVVLFACKPRLYAQQASFDACLISDINITWTFCILNVFSFF